MTAFFKNSINTIFNIISEFIEEFEKEGDILELKYILEEINNLKENFTDDKFHTIDNNPSIDNVAKFFEYVNQFSSIEYLIEKIFRIFKTLKIDNQKFVTSWSETHVINMIKLHGKNIKQVQKILFDIKKHKEEQLENISEKILKTIKIDVDNNNNDVNNANNVNNVNNSQNILFKNFKKFPLSIDLLSIIILKLLKKYPQLYNKSINNKLEDCKEYILKYSKTEEPIQKQKILISTFGLSPFSEEMTITEISNIVFKKSIKQNENSFQDFVHKCKQNFLGLLVINCINLNINAYHFDIKHLIGQKILKEFTGITEDMIDNFNIVKIHDNLQQKWNSSAEIVCEGEKFIILEDNGTSFYRIMSPWFTTNVNNIYIQKSKMEKLLSIEKQSNCFYDTIIDKKIQQEIWLDNKIDLDKMEQQISIYIDPKSLRLDILSKINKTIEILKNPYNEILELPDIYDTFINTIVEKLSEYKLKLNPEYKQEYLSSLFGICNKKSPEFKKELNDTFNQLKLSKKEEINKKEFDKILRDALEYVIDEKSNIFRDIVFKSEKMKLQ
jgi:hypothetical protein